jgi:membrane protein
VKLFDFIISFCVITTLFALMLKYIPDAQVAWKDVWIGATVTSLLFKIGKYLIGSYLGNSKIGSTFGAASSVIIIMLWTFYSAQIMLFGAEFTKIYANRFGSNIQAGRFGVKVVIKNVEVENVK